jgi:hypothetical protein
MQVDIAYSEYSPEYIVGSHDKVIELNRVIISGSPSTNWSCLRRCETEWQWGTDCIPCLSRVYAGCFKLESASRIESDSFCSPPFTGLEMIRLLSFEEGLIKYVNGLPGTNHWSSPSSSMQWCDHKLLSPKSRLSGAPLAEVKVVLIKDLARLASNAPTWLLFASNGPRFLASRYHGRRLRWVSALQEMA